MMEINTSITLNLVNDLIKETKDRYWKAKSGSKSKLYHGDLMRILTAHREILAQESTTSAAEKALDTERSERSDTVTYRMEQLQDHKAYEQFMAEQEEHY